MAKFDLITDEEIQRLIDRVNLPIKTSKADLQEALFELRMWNGLTTVNSPTKTTVSAHAEKVKTNATRLMKLLDPRNKKNPWRFITGPASAWALENVFPDTVDNRPNLRALREGLEELRRLSESLINPAPHSELLDLLLNYSPLEEQVGLLARIYEHHFDRRFGVSRESDGMVGGPFIRFADFCLNELHIGGRREGYAQESIARAVTTLRAKEKPTAPVPDIGEK